MRRSPIRWIALSGAVLLVGFVVVLAIQVGRRTPEPSAPRLVLEHAPAPSFTLKGLDGKPISSARLKNKTFVVNFFNSWCIPCQQEAPALKAFYSEHNFYLHHLLMAQEIVAQVGGGSLTPLGVHDVERLRDLLSAEPAVVPRTL